MLNLANEKRIYTLKHDKKKKKCVEEKWKKQMKMKMREQREKYYF